MTAEDRQGAQARGSWCRGSRVPGVRDRRGRAGLPVVPGTRSRHPPARTVSLMSALLRGDWVYADASERRHQIECSGLVAAYLQWHLEHSIRSLRHVEHA